MQTATTSYSKIAKSYDGFLTLTGFKRGIENFLDRLDFDFPAGARILDAGCGTGLIALYFARRFPEAEIYASDIDLPMLREMEKIVRKEMRDEKREIRNRQIIIGRADLREPEFFYKLGSEEKIIFSENYFDGIITSGALEHVPFENSLSRLVKLLKPGGIFLNLGMRRDSVGALLALMFDVRPYPIFEMRRACEVADLIDIKVIRLSPQDFPANLSRIAILAKKLT